LPLIEETHLPWSEIASVTSERCKFLYRSLVPFRYPLEVFTVATASAAIPFTVECVPGAKRAAREIASRTGQEVRRAG
jgi:hypothetical protein